MNEVTTQQGTAVSANQGNFFEAYGEQASQKSIVGTLLKFSKGDYSFGSNDDELPIGTKLIANMDQLLVGWIRWENSKPTDQLMGAVTAGFQPAKRKDLGDHDQTLWEVDNTGKSKDPWAFANYLVLKDPTVDGDNGLFTFTTSSRGGLNAIGELCKAYGKTMRAKPNDWPVITLGVDSYVHTDYGKIKVPEFEVIGWAPKSVFDDGEREVEDATAGNGSHYVEPKPADSTGRAPRGSGNPAGATKF